MQIYRIIIIADKYPTEYTIEASGWGTAINRAIKKWKQRFKGSRACELNIKAFKSGDLLRTVDKES